MELGLSGDPINLVFALAVAQGMPLSEETISLTVDGKPVGLRQLRESHGTRLHQVTTQGERAIIEYAASVDGTAAPVEGHEVDLLTYMRPSRYCESDTLGPIAATEFSGLVGHELLDAVGTWVNSQLAYVTGASQPTDGAVATVLNRQGVCRDFAHVVISLLRAMNMPARMVAVYAPGLSPMEFHAVAEAWVDDAWYAVDATQLAPRDSMVRVATGRDAADTAFLTNYWSRLDLLDYEVTAVVDGDLPVEDSTKTMILH